MTKKYKKLETEYNANYLVTYCLVFVAKVSFISFNHGFDTLSDCEGCLVRSSEAESPPPPYSELATVLVKLQFSVNRLLIC